MSRRESTACYTARRLASGHEAENAVELYLKIGHLPHPAYTGRLRRVRACGTTDKELIAPSPCLPGRRNRSGASYLLRFRKHSSTRASDIPAAARPAIGVAARS